MAPASEPSTQGRHFFHNVLWGWAGVIFSLIAGIFLSAYLIHHLGDERYGIWALAFSLAEYFGLVDLGFRSAVVKYTAHYRATGDLARLEELISTGLTYFTIAGAAVFVASLAVARNITWLFPHVLPRDLAPFRFLTVTVGIGFALAVVFSACTAVLEAYQRFDMVSRIMIVTNGLRVAGCFSVVYMGYGLRALGICVLASQIVGYALTYRAMRTVLPGRTFTPRKASLSEARQMMRYGAHSFLAGTSLMVLNQDAMVLIGHFLSEALVAYYSFPLRLLSYSVDLIGRVGVVTGSKAAELTAYGDLSGISRMAVLANRYSLMMFFPLAAYLSIFGRQLLQVWINPGFAANSAPLLPVLGAGVVIAVAAQFNSSAVLYGLAKHDSLARAQFIEAVLSVAGLWYVIPRHGILGAAYVVTGLMIVSRGLYVPYVVSRHVGLSFAAYLRGIYAKPAAILAPVAAVAWLANRVLGEPASWLVALGGGAAMAACYYAIVFFWGIEAGHRKMVRNWAIDGLRAIKLAH
ncbi:MAG: oligosaccharide flippase family protein [Bryobacteraceae bacterium]|jgi:O-antigen/teichoic acid export membrane protein